MIKGKVLSGSAISFWYVGCILNKAKNLWFFINYAVLLRLKKFDGGNFDIEKLRLKDMSPASKLN